VSGVRVGVVDMGTNTTRLLVAEVLDGQVTELEKQTTITRLGQGVDATGRLADEAMERVRVTLAGYREAMDRLGVENVTAVATSAMRDAENGPAFREELAARFGIHARTISGDEEARLTFLGATSDRRGAGVSAETPRARVGGTDGTLVVIDIGGGSTEFVVGRAGGEPDFHVSTQLGSVRQTERHLASDPPEHTELGALAAEARAIIEDSVPSETRRAAARVVAVAGTATTVAAIDQELDHYDAERVHGYEVPLATLERIQSMLAALPVVERREVVGLHPDRAPTIVAGVTILLESVRAFGLGGFTASEADILHGAALAAAADRVGG